MGDTTKDDPAPRVGEELPPPTLDRYTIQGELGKGGMGAILRARDEGLCREVALKVMRSADELDAHRFVLEAQITGQLDHPAVLPVYDLGRDEAGRPYFSMKLIERHLSLWDVIQGLREAESAFDRFSFKARARIAIKVCQALEYAHERGVVHRDIKPANVVLGQFGEVYLVDWGVAQVQGPEVELTAAEAAAVDAGELGMIVGTPVFMSPEQIMGEEATPQSDVYSLCALLYELLTLRHYLPEVESLDALREQIVQGRRIPPERFKNPVHGRVPRSLSVIVLKGLESDPLDRFHSARELEEALQRYLDGKAPIVCPGTCMQRTMDEAKDLIDQRPVLVPLLAVLAGSLLLGWLIYATRFVLTHGG